jgi:hypothetical protein
MIRRITLSAAAICLMTGTAFAAPTVMTDAQMDAQVAGDSHLSTIQTRSENIVWTIETLDPPVGFNNGGYDSTANASKGLVQAVGKGALRLVSPLE